jgi:hypothetical protein
MRITTMLIIVITIRYHNTAYYCADAKHRPGSIHNLVLRCKDVKTHGNGHHRAGRFCIRLYGWATKKGARDSTSISRRRA